MNNLRIYIACKAMKHHIQGNEDKMRFYASALVGTKLSVPYPEKLRKFLRENVKQHAVKTKDGKMYVLASDGYPYDCKKTYRRLKDEWGENMHLSPMNVLKFKQYFE